MTDYRKVIRRELMKQKHTKYFVAIKEYCTVSNTFKYHKEDFFQIFSDDPELLNALIEMDSECRFTAFCSELREIADDVALHKVCADYTPYAQVAHFSMFVPAQTMYKKYFSYPTRQKKLLYGYFYREIVTAYCGNSGKLVSKSKRGQIRNRYLHLTRKPQPYILNILGSSGANLSEAEVDPTFIQNSLLRSFK